LVLILAATRSFSTTAPAAVIKGKVTAVIGAVVDVQFDGGKFFSRCPLVWSPPGFGNYTWFCHLRATI
jgi:hypothetical protein